MKNLQESNNTSVYSKLTLHMPFPAMISLLVLLVKFAIFLLASLAGGITRL